VQVTLKNLITLLLLAWLFFTTAACKKAAPFASESTQPAAAPLTAGGPAPAPGEFKTVLTGKIGNTLNVQMQLSRQGDKLTGSYFYQRPGAANLAEKTLTLEGKIEPDGKATLSETALIAEQGEQKTGEFTGVLDSLSVNGEPRLRFNGVWTGAKSNKTAPFALQERRFGLGGYKLAEQPLQEKNPKLRMEIAARLPQLTGGNPAGAAKFNQAVAAFFNKTVAEFRAEATRLRKDEQAAPKEEKIETPEVPPYSFAGGSEVVYATPELISILFEYSTYFGGAHPNHFSLSYNYDLKRGAEVKLADLFAPHANFLQLISSYSIRELKKLSTTSDVETGAGPKLENFQSWNVTPLGLQFTFDPYQVGAYAVGAHQVLVPYEVLRPAIKPDGVLAWFIK
jgi:hypothetical protein